MRKFLPILCLTGAALIGIASPVGAFVYENNPELVCQAKTIISGPTTLTEGQSADVIFQITIRNDSLVASAPSVGLQDILSDSEGLANGTLTGASIPCTGLNTGALTCNVGSLGVLSQTSVTITGHFNDPQAVQIFMNTATVTGDLTPGNNGGPGSACEVTLLVEPVTTPETDLACTSKTVVPTGTIPAGEDTVLSYQVSIANNGPNTATGIVISDTLPAGVTFNSATADCSESAGVVTCPRPDLPANGTDSVMIAVTVPAANAVDGASFVNQGSVTGTNDSTPDNNNGAACRTTTTVVELGDEGCTPGYWRNHLEMWVATGYSPGDSWEAVFGVNLTGPLDGYTLEQAINQGGGGIRKVIRHGTAALLNAAHPGVDYPYTVAEVIAIVQSLDVDDLAAANDSYCPLD